MPRSVKRDRVCFDVVEGSRPAQHPRLHRTFRPAENVWEVAQDSRPVPPAKSSLPRLASHLPGRLLLPVLAALRAAPPR